MRVNKLLLFSIGAGALATAVFSQKKPTDDTTNPAYRMTPVVIAENTTG